MKMRLPSALYLRNGLILGLLLSSVACGKTERLARQAPAEPLRAGNDQYYNYDRGPAKERTADQTGGFESLKVASRLMGRDMPYRVILPVEYKRKVAERYAVVYLLHGLTGHFNDWTDRTNLVQIAGKYGFIIVTPEGNNGWYSDNPTLPNDKYESYIINDLIPEIDRSFRTLADRQHRVIAGLSMGGFGALKFGIKFREMFSVVGSFSGAFGIADWSEKVGGNKLIGKSVDLVFGPVNSEARKANDVFKFVREFTAENSKGLPFIYLSCGTEDPMIDGNRELHKILTEKNVLHDYRTTRGGHDWVFWGEQISEFLDLCSRRILR